MSESLKIFVWINKNKLAQLGLEVSPMKRSEFQEIFNSDLDRWGDIIRKLNIKN